METNMIRIKFIQDEIKRKINHEPYIVGWFEEWALEEAKYQLEKKGINHVQEHYTEGKWRKHVKRK